jgi:hypothetical protein
MIIGALAIGGVESWQIQMAKARTDYMIEHNLVPRSKALQMIMDKHNKRTQEQKKREC